MFGKIIDQIQQQHGDDAVVSIYLNLIGEIQKTYNNQQKDLDKIKKDYYKIEKQRLDKNKKKENGFLYFNGVYTGGINKKKLPEGKGTLIFQSRDKDFPDDNDMYIGEFYNGTKTGIGKYTYLNDRNIGQHPFAIPYYIGEWSGDACVGLGSKLIDKFDTLSTYEGEFRNNKIFGFGKWVTKTDEGDLELIGYFDDGTAVGFGLRIQKDKNDKIICDASGLCEYDNTDKNSSKSLLHFKFLSEDFLKIVDTKSKRKPIIQDIYDAIIDKGYFNQDIRTDKFKKLKLKAQSLHLELLFEVNTYFAKNVNDKQFMEFVDKQGEFKNNLLVCEQSDELEKWYEIIKKSITAFNILKKSLKK